MASPADRFFMSPGTGAAAAAATTNPSHVYIAIYTQLFISSSTEIIMMLCNFWRKHFHGLSTLAASVSLAVELLNWSSTPPLSVHVPLFCFCWCYFLFLFLYLLCIFIIIINPLTASVVGAPQMILQPVFSIFPCSPLPSGTCRTPGLSIPWCCLPTSSSVCLVFFPLSLCLARWFRPVLMNGRHDHTLQFASLYNDRVFVWSNCLLDLGTDYLVGNMVFVWDAWYLAVALSWNWEKCWCVNDHKSMLVKRKKQNKKQSVLTTWWCLNNHRKQLRKGTF